MMQGATMSKEWRTVQVFLSEKGVHEVEIDVTNKIKIRCNCSSYKKFFPCAHANYVRNNLVDGEDGLSYSISVPVDVDDEEAFKALENPEKFREFVLKHGKVLVID